jgi:hypothetical protein
MPNAIKTLLIAPSAALSDIVNDKGEVDFSLLLPMPKVMEDAFAKYDTLYPTNTIIVRAVNSDTYSHTINLGGREPVIYRGEPLTSLESMTYIEFESFLNWIAGGGLNGSEWEVPEQHIEQLNDMLRLKRATGYSNPLEWRSACWGCKKNAETISVKGNEFRILTPNSLPAAWLTALATVHHSARVMVSYVDLDNPASYVGELEFEGHKVKESAPTEHLDELAEDEQDHWRKVLQKIKG